MNSSHKLFELVKSLNKNEKRYLRLHMKLQSGSKKYIRLFEILEKEKVWDDKKVLIKYNKEVFTKNYSFYKHYLYRLIIKSLEGYNSGNYIDCRIHTLIIECKILFGKGLFREYFNTIRKAKALSIKHERFGYLLQILDMEKIIIRKEEVQSRKSEELYYEAITAIENFRSMFEYSRLASLLLQDYRAHGLRREQRHEEIFSEVLTHSAMKADTGSLCSRALESYYRINELISDSKGDLNGVLKALEKRFRVVKSNPGPFKDYVINYNNDILVSIIYTNLNLGNIQEAQEFIKLFERSGLKSNTEKASYEIMSAQVNFLTCLKTNKVKSAAALVPVLENILKSYENKLLIDTELSIRFNIVKCRMLEKNYNSALSSINTLLAHPFIDKRGDYELYLRLMNLIIHYELNNFSLLRYLIKSVYRFLFKRKKLYRLESLIIDFIKKLPEVKNESDLEYSLIRAKNELLELKEDDYERNAFEYFDFLRWVEEKLS